MSCEHCATAYAQGYEDAEMEFNRPVLLSEWQEQQSALAAVTRERETAQAQVQELRKALADLRINANRLCDRNQGGTYEEDCRRSLKRAESALSIITTTEPPREKA